ncbi:hypothetical protein DM01DRAFT_1319549 [Hesseltinella vesiculosa]|uniref:CNH-domain-containing protein n=1 Tax=Hesseltinella vesiculosa TaxID=101127 RepID=A0A1X2GN66_9FUNG|nr:hypothetical protein DM01DRAFT_1319549 [Hesseltinella vesiculosa]
MSPSAPDAQNTPHPPDPSTVDEVGVATTAATPPTLPVPMPLPSPSIQNTSSLPPPSPSPSLATTLPHSRLHQLRAIPDSVRKSYIQQKLPIRNQSLRAFVPQQHQSQPSSPPPKRRIGSSIMLTSLPLLPPLADGSLQDSAAMRSATLTHLTKSPPSRREKRPTRSSSMKHYANKATPLSPPPTQPSAPLLQSASSPTISPRVIHVDVTANTIDPPATPKEDEDFIFADRPLSTLNCTQPILNLTGKNTKDAPPTSASSEIDTLSSKTADDDDDDDTSTVFSPITPMILEPEPLDNNWPPPSPSLSETTMMQKGKKYWRKSSLGDITQSTLSLTAHPKKKSLYTPKRRHSNINLSVDTALVQMQQQQHLESYSASSYDLLGPTSAPPINSLTRQLSHASSFHSSPRCYPALLSKVAFEFYRRLPLRTLVKNDIEYPHSFSGKEAVDCLSQLLRTRDRNLSLVMGRTLGSQHLYHDVTYEHNLRDSQDKIYQFNEDIQLNDNSSFLDIPHSTGDSVDASADTKNLPSGVFTLLTHCYSPTCRRGQGCYSTLCPQNEKYVKRSYSQSSLQDREEQKSLWIHSVPKAVVEATPKDEIKRQECIYELIYTEADFVKSLRYVHNFWVRPLITENIVADEHREHFVQEVFWNLADIEKVNSAMLQALLTLQKEEQTIYSIGDILLMYVPRFDPFVAYGAHQIIGKYKYELEKKRNPLFAQFVYNVERLPDSRRLELNGYLTKPTTRLGRYNLLLREIWKRTPENHPDYVMLPQAIDIITSYLTQVNSEAGKCENIFNLQQIEERLSFKTSTEHVDLALRSPQRQLIMQGRMKRKINSSSDASDLQVFLFDHYLVFAKIKVFDHVEYFKAYRKPIPLELLSISTSTTNLRAKRTSTILSYSRQSVMYPSNYNNPHASTSETMLASSKSGGPSTITFYHHGRKGSPPLTLHVPNSTVRKTWVTCITQQQEQLMQSKCVFSVNTLVKRQFLTSNRVHDTLVIPKKKRDLAKFKAEDDEESEESNAEWLQEDADADDQVYVMLAATDLGVYMGMTPWADQESPLLDDMKRVIPLDKSLQIEILDKPGASSQLLVLADKTLWTFPLDEVFDTVDKPLSMKRGHTVNTNTSFFHVGQCLNKTLVCIVKPNTLSATTIRVLEPISTTNDQKTKTSFSIRRLVRHGNDVGLKPFKDLYLPSEASSIRLLKSKMCISCYREIGVVDMKSFGVQALLDPTDTNLQFVFSRQDIHPVTIFRVQFAEYLVCYDEFGFFVDQRGRLIQTSPFLEWEGEPDAFALSYPHVLAFEPGFVEVRNIITGQIDQLIRGSNIRCTNTRGGMIQGVMNDPDHEGYHNIFQLDRIRPS